MEAESAERQLVPLNQPEASSANDGSGWQPSSNYVSDGDAPVPVRRMQQKAVVRCVACADRCSYAVS